MEVFSASSSIGIHNFRTAHILCLRSTKEMILHGHIHVRESFIRRIRFMPAILSIHDLQKKKQQRELPFPPQIDCELSWT